MAGTNKLNINLQGGPAIILVSPQLPENIGMAARAMANFGLIDLRIVTPREEFPNEKAISAASKADYIIEKARLFESLEAALNDLSYVYATTARQRYSYKKVISAPCAMGITKGLISKGKKVGFMFGRERVGLLNSEISLANEIVTFPVNPAYASLNLAQAVLLVGYEWMKVTLFDENDLPFEELGMDPATKNSIFNLFAQIETALDMRGYFRPKEKKEIMINNLRGVLTRPNFSEQEIRLLRGVFSSFENFLPKEHNND